MHKETFCNRANRDTRAAELRRRGYRVKLRSSRNQVLSPDYVEDYTGYRSPNGFGGSADRFFAHLYHVEVD